MNDIKDCPCGKCIHKDVLLKDKPCCDCSDTEFGKGYPYFKLNPNYIPPITSFSFSNMVKNER